MRTKTTRVLVFVVAALAAASWGGAQPADAPSRDVLTNPQWAEIDRASRRGLAYLASQQTADGALPSHANGQPAVTALGVLACLQHGHMPGHGPYGKMVEDAIDYICRCQQPNGLIALTGPRGPIRPTPLPHEVGVATSYNHAIAGLTLSELYGMNPDWDKRLEPAISQALSATLTMQRWSKQRPADRGGWRYIHRFKEYDSDLSVVGWHLKFLRSAKNAGFEIPDEAIDEAVAYVLRCYTPELGSFEYLINGDDRRTRAMAGAGILALAHTSRHNRPEALAAADWILEHDFTRYNQQTRVGNFHHNSDRYHYGVFYCTLAMYQMGGRHWEQFFPPTAATLLANQSSDGGWRQEGAHDAKFGRCYTTSLVLLALGAPNQLLPIYQR